MQFQHVQYLTLVTEIPSLLQVAVRSRARFQHRSYPLYTATTCTASRHARTSRTTPERSVIHSHMLVLLMQGLRTLKATCYRLCQVRLQLPTLVNQLPTLGGQSSGRYCVVAGAVHPVADSRCETNIISSLSSSTRAYYVLAY